MPKIIDAHHHLWTADLPWLAPSEFRPIRREYTPDDLRAVTGPAGVTGTVLVEAGRTELAESVEFLRVAAGTPEIVGVVAWASLTDPALADTVAELRAGTGGDLLVGLRDQVQGQADDFLDRPDVRAGLRAVAGTGLVNELVVRAAQLPSVRDAVAALPDARFVLDHLGKPRIVDGTAGLRDWRAAITPVAACPNVTAKLSGLVTEADWTQWTVADLRPFVETAVELFGDGRLMFGSDWPVCELAASYRQVLDAFVEILGGTPSDVFGDTAARVYGLSAITSVRLDGTVVAWNAGAGEHATFNNP